MISFDYYGIASMTEDTAVTNFFHSTVPTFLLHAKERRKSDEIFANRESFLSFSVFLTLNCFNILYIQS